MPSVLTDEGWMVFNTQEEADRFRKQQEIERQTVIQMGETVGLVADEADAPDLPTDRKPEAEDESPTGFMKNIKKTFKKKGA